jgi:hypothetical protein
MKEPFSFNSFEKVVAIEFTRKSRSHVKKPSPFNSYKKAVPIQPSRKGRSHPIDMKKPLSFQLI